MSSIVDTLSPLTVALHVVDLILCFLSCPVGTWEVWFISTKHLYLENLSYIKKQQEQAEAQTKQYQQSNQQWMPVLTFRLAGRDNSEGQRWQSHREELSLDLDPLFPIPAIGIDPSWGYGDLY